MPENACTAPIASSTPAHANSARPKPSSTTASMAAPITAGTVACATIHAMPNDTAATRDHLWARRIHVRYRVAERMSGVPGSASGRFFTTVKRTNRP
jgi:hypothetical protein